MASNLVTNSDEEGVGAPYPPHSTLGLAIVRHRRATMEEKLDALLSVASQIRGGRRSLRIENRECCKRNDMKKAVS